MALRAKPLVLHRRGQIGLHVADPSQRELEDMRGRRGAARAMPTAVVPQQGGLFLRARKGDAKAIVVALPQRRRGDSRA